MPGTFLIDSCGVGVKEEPLPEELTRWLEIASAGEREAWERIMPQLYGELRRLAARYAGPDGQALTVPPTAIVHEAWAKLSERSDVVWKDREHFLAWMATAMRGLLVDHARQRSANRRGGGRVRTTLSGVDIAAAEMPLDILDLDEAIEAFAVEFPRQSKVVVLRFFGGLTHSEIANHLAISLATVEADWRLARAWLRKRLKSD